MAVETSRSKKGNIKMEYFKNGGGQETQDLLNTQTEEIEALDEKSKALKLARETDMYTIPIAKVDVKELRGVTKHPWENLWDHQKIDARTPIILERSKNVIGGPFKYFDAQENGDEKIEAVYIDSLKRKIISPETLKNQFKDEMLYKSFAYSLYAAIHYSISEIISFEGFCENFEEYFEQQYICERISDYILELDRTYWG